MIFLQFELNTALPHLSAKVLPPQTFASLSCTTKFPAKIFVQTQKLTPLQPISNSAGHDIPSAWVCTVLPHQWAAFLLPQIACGWSGQTPSLVTMATNSLIDIALFFIQTALPTAVCDAQENGDVCAMDMWIVRKYLSWWLTNNYVGPKFLLLKLPQWDLFLSQVLIDDRGFKHLLEENNLVEMAIIVLCKRLSMVVKLFGLWLSG